MRKFVALGVMLGLAIGAGFSAAAALDRDYPVEKKEETTKTLRFADSSRPGRVVVDNIFGFIHVEGYDGRDVELALTKTVFARNDARLQAALAEVKLDITEKAATVDLYVDGPFRDHERDRRVRERRDPGYIVRYDFTLRVPRRIDLDLATVTDGDVLVRGVEGNFAIHNVNGKVRLDAVAGSGEAETVNGEVRVVFRRAPGSDCFFKTLNGDVTLTFPGVPSADFRVKTMHGEIYTDFDTTPLAPLPPTTERREGKFVYRANRYSGVRTGKGGPEVRCETMTGDILIRREK
ncbi:MAG: hypothetical protein OEW05_03450 [Candidatus Aminicenantes bacterium]|nr:hypothetical protein [Candidatus Aminicenantes bacterium]